MRPPPIHVTWATFVACIAFASHADAAAPSGERADDGAFERDIRPLLAARCVACHGENKPAGGLRLDRRADALGGARGGTRAVIVPGDPSASALLARVVTPDDLERMPLDEEPLAPREIEALRAWIASGASWPDDGSRLAKHWAYVAPQHVEEPQVRDAGACANAIDRFVLARLEAEGLAPAPRADASTLLRRASLDLTGLPPSLEELDAFEREARVDLDGAYARALERLFASPHYAEAQAQHWLDLARYADTNGYEKDERRSMWPWRDWVIRAFDADMGFDRFTIEQIAGDLLPGATLDQRIATGFLRNTLVNQEGGTDPEEFRDAAVVDRVNTLGSVWLGSTLACAQCHDHKYDPFTQEDYYRLYAFFDQTSDTGNKLDPVLALPTKEQEGALAELEERKLELARRKDALADETRTSLRERVRALPTADWHRWSLADLPDENGAHLGGRVDGTAFATAIPPEGTEIVVPLHAIFEPRRTLTVRAVRIEATTFAPDRETRSDGPARTTRVVARIAAGQGERAAQVRLARGTLDVARRTPAASVEADEHGAVALAWTLDEERGARGLEALYEIDPPITLDTAVGWTLRVELGETPIRGLHLRAWTTSSSGEVDDAFALRATPWELAPPIPVESTEAGLRTSLGLEPGGERVTTWMPHTDPSAGASIALHGDRHAHFARRKLRLRAPRTVELALGGDDAFRAWIDGREIASSLAWPAFLERQVRVDVPLDAGEHELLVKVVNSSGPGALWCEIVEPARERVPRGVREVLTLGPEVPPYWQAAVAAPYMRALVDEAQRVFADEEKRLAADEEQLRAAIATTLVLEETRTPRTTRVHAKGSYLAPGAVVTPGVPAFLPQLAAETPRNRLGLATWLVSGENPLVARVVVNRMWERFFGRGLVATEDDFGTRGDAPTHPELLDWLASDFVAHGWSVKHLCRTIASSRTYQRASAFTPRLLERDAENRLLARQSRPRLPAETLRDVALASSGLLARKIGGPSVMPPQPDGVWAPVYSSDRWETSKGDDARRRGLYTFWRRSSPYATFQLFDAPSREQACTRRARTNTPLQALALLNDPAFVECARELGDRMSAVSAGSGATSPPGATGRVRAGVAHGFRACTSRAATERELDVLVALHADETRVKDGAHAWTAVANVLLNLDEALTRP